MVKNPPCQHRRCKRPGLNPWVGKIPWRRAGLPTPVFLPGESHGQRSLSYPMDRLAESQIGPKQLGTHARLTGRVRGKRLLA